MFRTIGFLLSGALLVMVSGCEQQAADPRFARIGEEQKRLQDELAALRDRAEKLEREASNLRAALTQETRKRLEDQDTKISVNHAALLEQLSSTLKESRESNRALVEERFTTVNQKLDERLSVTVAKQLKDMSAELDKRSTELKEYMRNQLKELYPYAYQPRRMDEATPPQGPQ